MVLYCNRFIILFTQIIHKKQTNTKIKKTFLILQYSTLKGTVIQYNSWHRRAGIKWTGKKSYWLEEGEEVGDGRTEGSSAIVDGGQVAISVMPAVDGTRLHLWKFTTWRFVCRGLTVIFQTKSHKSYNYIHQFIQSYVINSYWF